MINPFMTNKKNKNKQEQEEQEQQQLGSRPTMMI